MLGLGHRAAARAGGDCVPDRSCRRSDAAARPAGGSAAPGSWASVASASRRCEPSRRPADADRSRQARSCPSSTTSRTAKRQSYRSAVRRISSAGVSPCSSKGEPAAGENRAEGGDKLWTVANGHHHAVARLESLGDHAAGQGPPAAGKLGRTDDLRAVQIEDRAAITLDSIENRRRAQADRPQRRGELG